MLPTARRPVVARALLTTGLGLGLVACGGPVTRTPPAPPPTAACKVLSPGDAAVSASSPGVGTRRQALTAPDAVGTGPNLRRLVPGHGPPGNAPLKLGQLLSHRGEPSPAQWRALPPTADAELASHAADAEADPVLRARALSGLAVRRAVNAEPLMIRLLADAETEPAVRRAAARALAAGDLRADGPALAALTAALAAPDVRLREATARALGPQRGLEPVAAVLAARAAVEPEPAVVAVLKGASEPPTAEPAPPEPAPTESIAPEAPPSEAGAPAPPAPQVPALPADPP